MTDIEAKADSLMSRIEVNEFIGHQPAGGYGFRTGYWTYSFDGELRKVFCSVPHAAEANVQYARVRRSAALQEARR